MRKLIVFGSILMVIVATTGCQTGGRGMLTIPVSRDYQQLERMKIQDVEPLVEQAQRVGAQHYSPYEYYSAEQYLEMAKYSNKENDRPGTWDYCALTQSMAEAAIAKGGIPDQGTPSMPENEEACAMEFERLKTRYLELDKQKAIQVSPVIYAFVASHLSMAEHELTEDRQWPRAARRMAPVEAAIETIWSQDVDGDGIVDMKDGAPWAPEDKDGFEDADGVPDPDNDQDGILDDDDVKPMDPETKNRWHDFDGAPDQYPTLEMVHYASGSAALSSDAKGYLRGISQLVHEWPEIKLHVAGHTDNTHSEEYNIKLSNRRAEAVRDYLVANGCPEARLVVTFHGETQPVADNKTAEGKAMNRRVELLLE